jgi:fluoroquinolone transport system permease protein
MPSVTAVRGMLNADALRVLRDRFLVGISLYIIFIFFIMRAAIPAVTKAIALNWDFDLTPYHPLIVSHFVVQLAPLIPGIVGGFLLVESREDGTVKALLVSPNPLSSYLSVMSAVMYFTAAVLVMVAGPIIGLRLPPGAALFLVALAAAPAGPAFALLIAAIANNKVQAFAYMKIFGSAPLISVGAYFLPEPWQWLAAIYPPYCACKAYWVAEAGGSVWPLWVLLGLIASAFWLGVLRRAFFRAARR